MQLKLFHTNTRDRESNLEIVTILLDHIEQGVESRHVRALCYVGNATLILVVIVIIMVGTDIKEAVAFEMNYLMYLKI